MGTDTHPPTASRVARKKRAATAVLVIACTLVIATAGIVAIALIFKRPRLGISAPPPSSCANTCTLIVEPDDGIAPIVAMMHNATRSIDLTIYELNDHAIESALIAAVRRGVTVRVLLSAGYDGAKAASANQTAYDALHAGGVPVHWGPGYFALVHQKSIVVDGDTALIMSFNLAEQYYATGRDFGIVDRDANDVTAIETTFINDWNGNPASAPAANDLVWSPGARTTLIALIASAKTSLLVYNEEMADTGIENALIDAARRGVRVRILMTYSDEWTGALTRLVAAGAEVRTYPATKNSLYIHAKVIIADSSKSFIGSENFSITSLDDNRELGIMVTNKAVIRPLIATFENDWTGATKFFADNKGLE
jgi:phosphatidylserine/phosphatidylglycerophosphate/cardiolipin synthase-like enzyme